MSNYEVELKFPVADFASLRRRLAELGAAARGTQQHRDTYFNHPCRDFAQTQEALRVRRIDDVPLITYKGSKLDNPVKTRIELEWALGAGDPDGLNTETLLLSLGFRRVAEVVKSRETFTLNQSNGGAMELTVTLDEVQDVGLFAEIECVAQSDGVQQAQRSVQALAQLLGLQSPEPRSYLRMLLESQS